MKMISLLKPPYKKRRKIYVKELKGTFNDALKQRKVVAAVCHIHAYVLFDIDREEDRRLKGSFKFERFISYSYLKKVSHFANALLRHKGHFFSLIICSNS